MRSCEAQAFVVSAAAAALLLWQICRRRGRSLIITDEQWKQFEEEGFIVLPPAQVFDNPAADVMALQQRINEIMLGAAGVPYEKMMMQLDSTTGAYGSAGEQTLGFKGATLRYRKIQNLDLDPLVMSYLRRPVFREACRRIYGPLPISSFRTMFFNKPRSHESGQAGGTHLPWHQCASRARSSVLSPRAYLLAPQCRRLASRLRRDRWRYLDRDPLLNVYLALDPATKESGCVRFLPRSHKLGVVNPHHHSAFLTEEQAERLCGPRARLPVCELVLRPGEVALIHNWVIHSSGVNSTAQPRRALSVSFMDARTRLDHREFGGFLGGEHKSSGYPEGGMHFPLIFS